MEDKEHKRHCQELSRRASQVFIPSSPITSQDLFAGRLDQINKLADAINQNGQHAILFGERGVGKTSIANVLAPLSVAITPNLIPAKVNCDATDTFDSVWRKALQELKYTVEKKGPGFQSQVTKEVHSLAEGLTSPCTPNDLRLLLGGIGMASVIIFDEFDRLAAKHARIFTDLIKTLSDYSVPTTLVLVGVAGTVDQLIKDHASIERALVQIPMPRMKSKELKQIISVGADKLGISFEPEVSDQIVQVSQGLPHYTHLLGLHAARNALDNLSLLVNSEDLQKGMESAAENAHHSLKTQYHNATTSSHKSALFEQVLLACALATKDQLSFFRATDVVYPLSLIMGSKYDVPAFARHLSEFCTLARGNVLERQGEVRRIRYRFTVPLLEPYIVMHGRAKALISAQALADLA